MENSANGNVVFSNSQSVINLTTIDNDTIILYAIWERNTYYVKYDANGGVGSMNNSIYTYDEYKALSNNVLFRSGFQFAGWSNTPNGEMIELHILVNIGQKIKQ